MAFLRSMWRTGKHNKLETGEKKCLAKDLEGEPSSVMPDAVSFSVKYLGSTIVSNNTTTTAAVDTILSMAKVAKRKHSRVTVNVTLNGIMISDAKTGNLILDASVYRISNCSTDPVRNNIFTFFAMNKYDIIECHAFQCQKRKMAQNITLTVANSFRIAYEAWQRGHQMCSQILSDHRTEKMKGNSSDVQLIDLSETKDDLVDSANNWVRFENDKEDSSKVVTNNTDIKLLPPPEKQHSRSPVAVPVLNEHFADDLEWT